MSWEEKTSRVYKSKRRREAKNLCSVKGVPDSMTLKSQRCDEDVDENREEDKDCCYIIHSVHFGVFPHIVEIVLHC